MVIHRLSDVLDVDVHFSTFYPVLISSPSIARPGKLGSKRKHDILMVLTEES